METSEINTSGGSVSKVNANHAYVGIVLIWATTPLAVKWSNSSLSFISAVSLRMVLALIFCLVILLILRRPLVRSAGDWRVFFAGSISLFPSMLLVYWSAQYVPSGLISVVLAVYPFMVGVFSILLLKENMFTKNRVVALIVAILGLALVQRGQLHVSGTDAVLGIVGLLIASAVFAFSTVWMKSLARDVEPLQQTTGSLLLSVPALLLTWYYWDGLHIGVIDDKSLFSMLYLAVVGSVLGGILFFKVLTHCRVSSVGLITLLTPVAALVIGAVFNDEKIEGLSLVGCIIVMLALAIYQNIFRFNYQALLRFIPLSGKAG
ncbi:MAG: hypothetical protein COA42_02505 [Alteromonadaceae bacterium]|nr:MAG: hypothetical protein COA42_02505 [Alteromonadaceae bacterium]